MNYQLTANQLEEMLSQPQYQSKLYETHQHPHFEKLNGFGDTVHLFDELVESLGRIPTQDEYVAAGMVRTEHFFKPVDDNPNVVKKWGRNQYSATFNWNDPELQKAATKRLSRTYPSLLVEYTTIIQLKSLYPNYHIGTNKYLDSTAGIDIVVGSPEHNRILYIHVTSNSPQSAATLQNKSGRGGLAFDKNGNKHWYKRNFNKGHIHLAFDKYSETTSTRFVNGNPILKAEHIKAAIDLAMELPDPSNNRFDRWQVDPEDIHTHQLCKLQGFLIMNNIDDNGILNMWV